VTSSRAATVRERFAGSHDVRIKNIRLVIRPPLLEIRALL
jgi:hypothetical protein